MMHELIIHAKRHCFIDKFIKERKTIIMQINLIGTGAMYTAYNSACVIWELMI